MTTNVPAPTFSANGYTSPTEEEILDGVLADMNAAFGGNLNTGLSTPQGQLASSEAAMIGNVYDAFAFVSTQTDPAFASGRYQDAIGRIYFLTRLPALPTLVDCTVTGLSGTVIPTGSLAIATDGNIYSASEDATIPVGGSISISFECQTTGPIACPAETLNTIYRAIPGWDTIINPDDGVIGQDTESRYAFELRRQQSVAQNSVGSLPSILGAVLSVDGVIDAYVTDNSTGAPVVVNTVTIAARSIYVTASGGTDLDVATAIWSKKAPGAGYNGNTPVVVQDQSSGYSPPYPSYTVTFERPTELPILIVVNILNSSQVPSNVTALVQNAIIAAFAGSDGGARPRIGSTIFASRFVAPVAALGSWALISSIVLGSTNSSNAVVTASIAGTVMTVTAVSSGTLAVGQTILRSGILDGTKIASLGTGVGGTGTYNLNKSQTLGSGTTTAVLPAATSVVVHIDQIPTIAADNITVTLV